ncbi:girdin-like [Engraulis encrasicolus]|uniref:girdin-like n=1 Tax=Engraulis encrasicolus TaxID=184585 RepID=UPI002FD130E1
MQNNADPGGPPLNLPPDLGQPNSAATFGNPAAHPVEKERKAFLTAEEEEIWASNDLNTTRKSELIGLLKSRTRLLETNVHLQQALNGAEDSCAQLEASNNELKAQLKSAQVSSRAIEALKLEMDEVKTALSQSLQNLGSSQAKYIQLQRENKVLKETVEAHNNKVSDISFQRRKDKETMALQKNQMKALKAELRGAMLNIGEKGQMIMERNAMIRDLEVAVDELTAIREVQREKIHDLEEELELALIHGGGSTMGHDGSISVGTNHLSLAQELMSGSLDLENNKPINDQLRTVFMETNAEMATAHLEVPAMQRAEAKHMDLTAEGSGQAKTSSDHNNNVLQVDKSSRPFQTALLVTGVVGIGLFTLWKLKS